MDTQNTGIFDKLGTAIKDSSADFFAAARAQLSRTRSGSADTSIGGSIWDVMYAGIRGRENEAYSTIADKFRRSNAGMKIEAEVTRQKISELKSNPKFWIIGIVIFVVIFMLGSLSKR